MSDSRREKVFHHTSRSSAENIIRDGRIKMSDANANRDAVHGPGTYVTKMGPQYSPDAVAKNNWDGATRHWERQRDTGKTDVVFEINHPKSDLKSYNDRGRSVLKTSGDVALPPDTKVHVRDMNDPNKYTTYKFQ
jgi:hypothetical protein